MNHTLTALTEAIAALKGSLILFMIGFGFICFVFGACFVLALWLINSEVVKYSDLNTDSKDIIDKIK